MLERHDMQLVTRMLSTGISERRAQPMLSLNVQSRTALK